MSWSRLGRRVECQSKFGITVLNFDRPNGFVRFVIVDEIDIYCKKIEIQKRLFTERIFEARDP